MHLSTRRGAGTGLPFHATPAKALLVGVFGAAALLAAPARAQSSVEVYGLLDIGMTYNNRVATTGNATRSRVSIDSGNLQGSRLGFRGTEKLADGLNALFIIENGHSLDTGAAAQGGLLFGRTAVVGLSGNFGRVTVGRQVDFTYSDLAYYNTVIPMGTLVLNVRSLNLDRSEGSRVNNSIRYNTPVMNGLSGSVIYGLGEQAGNSSAGRSLGAGVKYEHGSFRIGVSFFQSKAAAAGGTPITTASSDAGIACTNVNGKPGDTCLKTGLFATSYKVGRTRVYGSWSQVRLPLTVAGGPRRLASQSNDKMDVLDVGVEYDLTQALHLLANTQQNHAEFKGSDSKGRVRQFNVGLDYRVSRRTDFYGWVGSQRTADMLAPGIFGAPGADNSQTVVQAGIRSTF